MDSPSPYGHIIVYLQIKDILNKAHLFIKDTFQCTNLHVYSGNRLRGQPCYKNDHPNVSIISSFHCTYISTKHTCTVPLLIYAHLQMAIFLDQPSNVASKEHSVIVYSFLLFIPPPPPPPPPPPTHSSTNIVTTSDYKCVCA